MWFGGFGVCLISVVILITFVFLVFVGGLSCLSVSYTLCVKCLMCSTALLHLFIKLFWDWLLVDFIDLFWVGFVSCFRLLY